MEPEAVLPAPWTVGPLGDDAPGDGDAATDPVPHPGAFDPLSQIPLEPPLDDPLGEGPEGGGPEDGEEGAPTAVISGAVPELP